MSTQNKSIPIWMFGAISLSVGMILYLTGIIGLELAIGLVILFGMPTWFIGLIWFGMKSDELFGVEDAFDYEAPQDNNEY